MEFEFSSKKITFHRELSNLDLEVIKFAKILNSAKISYVFVSGYVAIVFGRSRETEDIDLFIEQIDFHHFEQFWTELGKNGFYCINAFSAKEAFEDFLSKKLAIRLAENGKFIPNFEVKFVASRISEYALENKVELNLNGSSIFISELELQIAFKLKLGAEKDFEDALHIYSLFKDKLDSKLLKSHIEELNVAKEAEKILWQKH